MIEKKNHPNLTMLAYEKMKEAIISCQMPTGCCISGSRIAQQLNMSRTPVREAIQLLEKEGLVEMQKGVGFYVHQLTVQELKEITQVRILLECAALRASVDHLHPDAIQELISEWYACRESIQDDGKEVLKKIRLMDTVTHEFLTRHCNNNYLIEILNSIEVRSIRVQYLSIEALNMQGAIQQHLDILLAVQVGRIEQAITLLVDHINFSLEYILNHPYLMHQGQGAYLSDDQLKSIF